MEEQKYPRIGGSEILKASGYTVLSPPDCFLISPGIHVLGIVVS